MMADDDLALVWRLGVLVESVHAVVYFAPEPEAAYAELGLRGYWPGYFASRAAPMGAAEPLADRMETIPRDDPQARAARDERVRRLRVAVQAGQQAILSPVWSQVDRRVLARICCVGCGAGRRGPLHGHRPRTAAAGEGRARSAGPCGVLTVFGVGYRYELRGAPRRGSTRLPEPP